MSWKGISKAVKRTPHMVTSKVGISSKSADGAFHDQEKRVQDMEFTFKQFYQYAQEFRDVTAALLNASCGSASALLELFSPITILDSKTIEPNLMRGDAESSPDLLRNAKDFDILAADIRQTLLSEIDVLDSRVIYPLRDLLKIFKQVRTSITKRNHKLTDFDRFKNSLKKFKDKKEPNLNDEKNILKLELELEKAQSEYDEWNKRLNDELPKFINFCEDFIEPLWQTFYFLQVNIYYLSMERLDPWICSGYFKIVQPDIIRSYNSRSSSIPTNQLARLQIVKSNNTKLSPNKTYSDESSDIIKEKIITKPAPPRPPVSKKPSYRVESSGNLTNAVSTPVIYTTRRTSSASMASNLSLASVGSIHSSDDNGSIRPAAIPYILKPPPGRPPPLPANKPKLGKTYVSAIYPFQAQTEGDLSFNVGDKIEILERTASNNDWWRGRSTDGREGVFPANYVKLLS